MYKIKIIGTDNNNVDFDDMISYTVLNVSRWEIELSVLSVKPKHIHEGDVIEGNFSGVRTVSRARRLAFDVEFEPFSTLPEKEHNTGKRMYLYDVIFSKSHVWLALPESGVLPRYHATTGISLVNTLLPCRVEPDFAEPSLNSAGAAEELTITLQKYKR